jgi:hypothetical protein
MVENEPSRLPNVSFTFMCCPLVNILYSLNHLFDMPTSVLILQRLYSLSHADNFSPITSNQNHTPKLLSKTSFNFTNTIFQKLIFCKKNKVTRIIFFYFFLNYTLFFYFLISLNLLQQKDVIFLLILTLSMLKQGTFL